MDACKIVQRVIIFLVSGHNVFSLTLQTKDVVTISQEDNSIVLNCTYHKESNEEISNRNIRWQKQIGDKFKDIAMFSLPGGPSPVVVKEMQPLYDNRTELIAPNSTLAAVLIIKNPVCSDEGIYQCKIVYFSDDSEKNQTSSSVVELEGK